MWPHVNLFRTNSGKKCLFLGFFFICASREHIENWNENIESQKMEINVNAEFAFRFSFICVACLFIFCTFRIEWLNDNFVIYFFMFVNEFTKNFFFRLNLLVKMNTSKFDKNLKSNNNNIERDKKMFEHVLSSLDTVIDHQLFHCYTTDNVIHYRSVFH